MKTGLILEGGSMRGLFSAGVMDVFLEHDIEFDGAIGVSAGATFGCNYKSKQPGRVIRYNKRYARDPRYCSFASLLTTGNLYNANFCYHVMPVKYDIFDLETFRKNPMEFWVVTTDLETAEPVYHELKTGDSEDMEWLRASASLPIAARPVKLDGREYMDGGCSDSLPLGFFESQGYDKNVVILTQPKGYVKPVQKALGITKVLLHGQDKLYARLENRHNEYNEQLAYVTKREEEGAILAIYPDEPLDIGFFVHDADKMQHIYEMGRDVGEKYLSQVQEYLAS
ncbi:MAG: patatin family protein [Clostridia bacterium]|jgi:Predicted esterase of the alpha-beta hydrolase superfamily|nr:patatin family protein [Oscillospiraceae bacterium]MBQ2693076.1 patatin family protein [Clostridia bacterium]MBQ4458923.1 patatin family protein [Clostridia bacterium]MBQ6525015.1 patatin family protein [Clostridia bacterium]MBQ6784802.1 patatin family protein [Clostridia bacterium]